MTRHVRCHENASDSRWNSRISHGPWFSTGEVSSAGVDFDHLKTRSRDFEDSPTAARQWLNSFQDSRQKHPSSIKLRAVKKSDIESKHSTRIEYPSLLPVLTRWLSKWFDRAVSARRQEKKNQPRRSKRATAEEDADFEWICNYVVGYLLLPHEGLNEFDLVALNEAALDICGKVVYEADIERPLKILTCIFHKHGCFSATLERSFYVLCGISGSVGDLAGYFFECLDALIATTAIQLTTEILHKFLRVEAGKLENVTFNVARGAIQLLDRLMRTAALPTAVTDELLVSLAYVAAWQKQPMSELALQLCNRLANNKSSTATCSVAQFKSFMSVINTAYMSMENTGSTMEEDSSKPRTSASTPGPSEKGGGSQIKDAIDMTLTRLFFDLPGDQKYLVFEHLVQFAESQPADRLDQLLEYLELHSHSSAELMLRKHYWFLVVRRIIGQTRLAPETRLAATYRVRATLSGCVNGSASSAKDILAPEIDPIYEILEELGEQIGLESNARIVGGIVELLVWASLNLESKSLSQTVINALEKLSCREREFEQSSTCSVVGVDGLVSIFMESLYTDNFDRTKLAYRNIVQVASSFQVAEKARLAALRLLLRIRCDWEGGIYVSGLIESEHLAAALGRTDEAVSRNVEPADSSDNQSTPRSSGVSVPRSRSGPVLWTYPGDPPLPLNPKATPSDYICAFQSQPSLETTSINRHPLDLNLWFECMINCLQKDPSWETYSYIIVHTGAQLLNVRLFKGSVQHIRLLRSVLCDQVMATSYHEPPVDSGLKKGDVALCVFDILSPLVAYKDHFSRNECDKLVQAFTMGIGSFEGTSRVCINSLCVSCCEIPGSVTKNLSAIIHKIQTSATQAHLSMHYLEFFAGLARLPPVHMNLHGDEIRLIFGICISYIKSMRDRPPAAPTKNENTAPSRLSGVSVPPSRIKMTPTVDSSQYVTVLAYHTMIFWFLSLKLSERAKHVAWIVKSLVFVDKEGNEQLEEQSEVFIDMMQRTSFSDIGETIPDPRFSHSQETSITSTSWLVGLSIVTVETDGATGLSQVTKRQASGTTHSIYHQHTASIPKHHAPLIADVRPETSVQSQMLPQHVLLQMMTTCAPTSQSAQPLLLPDADYVRRAIKTFDRNPTVDGTKVGVIFVGPGQKLEADILRNSRGSADFDRFLDGLGTKVNLADAELNHQGLRAGIDGDLTYAWRDRVTEIVYHVPCMMPTNLDEDPQCTNKKMHIGNDHVNIIFNQSGEPFDFDTIGSQFNYVNIVVTPASRPATSLETEPSGLEADRHNTAENEDALCQFYHVKTLTAQNFPAVSPASDTKLVSASTLPTFVRIIALNASVFSLAWRARDSPDDHVSSWRNRLQEIRRLRDRVVRETAATAPEPRRGGALYAGLGKGVRASLYPGGRGDLAGEQRRPALIDYDTTEGKGGGGGAASDGGSNDDKSKLAELYDFSHWTLS